MKPTTSNVSTFVAILIFSLSFFNAKAMQLNFRRAGIDSQSKISWSSKEPLSSVSYSSRGVDETATQSSRRNFIFSSILGSAAVVTSFSDAKVASATTTSVNSDNVAQTFDNELEEQRKRLLEAISSSAGDKTVLDAINDLKPLNPCKGESSEYYADQLDGEWKLLWSIKAEAFSPLLKLPYPFKPDSYQYFGKAAENEVGFGRVAQGLSGGAILSPINKQIWLSSGVTAAPGDEDSSVLTIQPPFRLQIGGPYGSNQEKNTIVEAGSDAEFRKVNARTKEAQEAGKNKYKQLYVENNGAGSLRISEIIEGDPVIVGAIFVHQKLS